MEKNIYENEGKTTPTKYTQQKSEIPHSPNNGV